RAAVWDARDRRLTGHERRERADLVQVDLGVEANAALVRPARPVVLHAEPRVHVDPAVAQPDGDLDLDLAVRGPENGGHVLADVEPLDRSAEVVVDDLVVRQLGPLRLLAAVGLAR